MTLQTCEPQPSKGPLPSGRYQNCLSHVRTVIKVVAVMEEKGNNIPNLTSKRIIGTLT